MTNKVGWRVRWARRAVATVVTIGVVAGVVVPIPLEATASVARTALASTVPPNLPATAAEFFGAAGVTVTPLDAPVPGVGLSLTDWQADNLYRQARAGEGWTGAQWRTRFPLPDDVVPVDFIVAGWLVGTRSAAADAARLLVDEAPLLDAAAPMDPAQLVISPAVMALFLHDVAVNPALATASTSAAPAEVPVTEAAPAGWSGAESSGRSPTRRGPRPAQVDACEGMLTFYDGALQSIYDLVGGKDSVIGQLAQQAVGLLPIPKPAYHIPTKNDMGNFQAIGLLIGLAGAINPWTISITATPDPVAYGIAPAAGNEAVARLVVDPGISVEWPAPLKSCASLAGVDLPDISPVGAVVFWDPVTAGLGPHATVVDHTDVVMSDGTEFYADLRYVTAVESAEQAAGIETYAALPIIAEIQRPGDQTFKGVVQLAIDRYLGPDSTFGALLGALVGPLVESLDEINSPLPTFAFPSVTFHLPPDPTPPVEPTATPPPGSGDEPWRACVDRDLFSVASGTMPGGVRLRIAANGASVLFDFAGSGVVNADAAGVDIQVQLAGTISGSSTPADNRFATDLHSMDMSGIVTIDGQAVAMDEAMLTELGAGSGAPGGNETLTCNPDGSVTVDRTGQLYT